MSVLFGTFCVALLRPPFFAVGPGGAGIGRIHRDGVARVGGSTSGADFGPATLTFLASGCRRIS